jgi:hypothetical protein
MQLGHRPRLAHSAARVAVVEYIGWFNKDRRRQALGDILPAEMEALYAPRTRDQRLSRHEERNPTNPVA